MNDTAENPRRGAQQHGRGQPSEKTLERTRLVYISYFGFYLPSAKTVTAAAGLMQSAVWSLTDVLRRRSSVVLGPRSFLLQLQSGLRSATQCYSGLNLKTECGNRKLIQLWSDEAEKVTVFLCVPCKCVPVSLPCSTKIWLHASFIQCGFFSFFWLHTVTTPWKYLPAEHLRSQKRPGVWRECFFLKLKLLFYICNLWFYVNKMLMLVRNNQVNVGLAFQIQTI